MLRGSTQILDTVCKELGGIQPGQTTKDGKFTVIEVECQGACSNAPMMAVGDDFYVSAQIHPFFFFCLSDFFVGRPDTGNDQENS
jgi:NADH:ubiquinone oxidoreductase subunit E